MDAAADTGGWHGPPASMLLVLQSARRSGEGRCRCSGFQGFRVFRVLGCGQAFDFMGGSEATFIHGGARWTLTVTYKGEGGGSILFHQTSWDPVFLADVDPEQPADLARILDGQVRSQVLSFSGSTS